MKYTFQHFVDLKTSGDSMQIIQVDAGGSYMLQRIKHLIGAFKYMKLGRISIKMLPASTLPVDVLGLSYDDEDPNTIDPRDQMNPGLVRITNGEDIYTDVASLTEEQQMSIYNNMMLDPRWSKFMLQNGFKRSATPLYWQVGQLHQDYFTGATVNLPNDDGGLVAETKAFHMYSTAGDGNANLRGYFQNGRSDPRGLFQVGHRGRMGWIPTDALIEYGYSDGVHEQPAYNAMPSINCITVVLPKAYKTVYYYRMFITETVYLSGLKNTGITGETDGLEYRGIDNFIPVQMLNPQLPSVPLNVVIPRPRPPNDGDD